MTVTLDQVKPCYRLLSMLGAKVMPHPASPCIGHCQIAAQTGWCEGCWRSLAEIAAWPGMAARDKQAVLARLSLRQQGREKPRP